jgi:hypothetical protein
MDQPTVTLLGPASHRAGERADRIVTSAAPPSATERHAPAERELRIITRPDVMSATDHHDRR